MAGHFLSFTKEQAEMVAPINCPGTILESFVSKLYFFINRTKINSRNISGSHAQLADFLAVLIKKVHVHAAQYIYIHNSEVHFFFHSETDLRIHEAEDVVRLLTTAGSPVHHHHIGHLHQIVDLHHHEIHHLPVEHHKGKITFSVT